MVQQAFDIISPVSPVNQEYAPIIFLHGLLENRKTWKNTAPAIARNTSRKVYILDARNHGESERIEKMDLDSLTDDVLEFMNERHIQKAILLGSSLGGKTAINFALKYPNRLEMLIIEDMPPKNLETGKETVIWLMVEGMDRISKMLPSDIDERTGKQVIIDRGLAILPSGFLNHEKFTKNYELDMVPVKKIGNAFIPTADVEIVRKMLLSNPFHQNFPESNLRYNGDTLFVYGTNSLFHTDKDPSIKKLFPKVVLKAVKGATHLTHVEYPDQFVEIVSNFILNSTIPKSKY